MAKRRGKTEKVKPIRSVRALAELIDRPSATVGGWLQHPDWPFPRHSPWPAELKPEILRWAADHLKTEVADDESNTPSLRRDKLKAEIRKIKIQSAAAETSLAIERGQLLDAADVQREWRNIGTVMRTAMQDFGSSVVSLALQSGLSMSSAPEFTQKVNELAADTLGRLSRNASDQDRDGDSESVLEEPDPKGAVDAEPVGRKSSPHIEQGGIERARTLA